MPRSLAGSLIETLDAWQKGAWQPLGAHHVHVWRIRLDGARAPELWPVLSHDEQARARRFHFPEHRDAYVMAHGMLRRILARYAGMSPDALVFDAGEFGKPALRVAPGSAPLEFSLSHSGDYALLAVSRAPVGVDIERWKEEAEHLELATRFFSTAERDVLHELAAEKEHVVAGFFAAWSRKEAYLKARGDGITHGLDHFDVSLRPGQPAELIEDRTDASARSRWVMCALAPASGYAAALVAASPVEIVLLCDAG